MILQILLAQLAPHDCLVCGCEGYVLCAACSAQAPPLPSRCYRCKRLTEDFRTCPSCRASSLLFAVYGRAAYAGSVKAALWRLKFQGMRQAADDVTVAYALPSHMGRDTIVVPVPTASSRVRQRGYDQALLLARALAKQYGLPYANVLRRMGQHHQVGASRQKRLQQLQEAYRCVDAALIQGAHIVLVDDVCTTGATLEAAAKVIKRAGAARVSAAVCAQA